MCTAFMAAISSSAALMCTAYDRSSVKQRSRGRRRCRRRVPRVSDPRYGSPPTRFGSCGARVTDGRIGKQNIAAPDIAELRDELRRAIQMLALLVNAAGEGETASFTLKIFLARNHLSESQYHKLRRKGRGPRVMSVGSCGVRISRHAELDWIEARETEARPRTQADE